MSWKIDLTVLKSRCYGRSHRAWWDSNTSYKEDDHTDRYLRGRLISALVIPEIENSLRDRTLRTCHQFINKVANRLSTRTGASGTESNIAQLDQLDEPEDLTDALNNLAQKYGGHANRQIQ